jgi:hypothetical protein
MALIKLNNQSISAVSALPSGIDTGKVGQIVQATNSTAQTTTSTSFVATSLAVNITPTATSSKIFIIASCSASNNNSGDVCRHTIMRDSTPLNTGEGSSVLFSSASTDIRVGVSVNYLDSPNSTSQITFALGHRTGGAATSEINKNSFTGSITAMEILA